jgi:hypothetical protein
MTQAANEFNNLDNLTKWLKYFIYLQIFSASISVIVGYLEYNLLSRFNKGDITDGTNYLALADQLEIFQIVVALLYSIIFIISGIVILRWLYKANQNAHQLGAKNMQFTPAWSIGWYFIPLALLFKPYQAMKELWQTSIKPSDWYKVAINNIIPIWWALFLFSGFFGRISYKLSTKAESIDDFLWASIISQVSDAMDIPLALISLSLFTKIYLNQKNNHEQQQRLETEKSIEEQAARESL